jgi:hypothetical protein
VLAEAESLQQQQQQQEQQQRIQSFAISPSNVTITKQL